MTQIYQILEYQLILKKLHLGLFKIEDNLSMSNEKYKG